MILGMMVRGRVFWFFSFCIGATLLFAFFAFADSTSSPQADSREARPEREDRIAGQYIVVLKDSVENADLAETELIVASGAERMDSYRYALRGFSARLSESDVAKIESDPRVAFVSEDRVVSIDQTREDFSALAPRASRVAKAPPSLPPQTLPTGVDRINAEALSNTGGGVQIAVIDTGIDINHPDLKANVLGGRNCTTRSASAYIDQNGHGTHVAGTIGAVHNVQGVVGVAPSAKLWAIRVLDRNGKGSWSSVICGLDTVAANGPRNGGAITVANMSLGGSGVSDNNCGITNKDALHSAVCRVRDAGVVLVVAAGNSGANAANFVPAAYDDAVITVSALGDSDGKAGGTGKATGYGADDTFASFSNWGAPVDIGAPGVAIYSTWLSSGYKAISGTSMAAPHVAGAAALYIATHAGASWTQVRDALISLGEPAGAGHTDPSGKHPEVILRVDSL